MFQRPYPLEENIKLGIQSMTKMVTNVIKLIRETTYIWKMQNIQQEFVSHAFKSDEEWQNDPS